MNARFDDGFQCEMIGAARSADGLVVFNRLWDDAAGVAYGGYDLSGRNPPVLAGVRGSGAARPPLSGTGNIATGRMAVAYARAGCTSVQIHTGFQLPRSEYAAEQGSRSAMLLHRIIFDPHDGLAATMLELAEQGVLERHGGELRFIDLARREAA